MGNEVKTIALLGCVALAAVACGLFGDPPGEAACNHFKKTVIDWRQGELNTFEFRERLGEVREKAESAEPEIDAASANLLRSANSLSEDRLLVSIEVMGEACVRLGYLSQHTF